MSEDREVEFGEEFWRDVHRRAKHVRELAAAELIAAEERVLGPEAEVLPLFTEPFWKDIHRRSERVRALAVRDLQTAEDRLVAGKEVAHRPSRRLSPQFWARAQGFAMAVLATLALLPQIAPVLSWADIGTPSEDRMELEGVDANSPQSAPDSVSGAVPRTGGNGDGGDLRQPGNAERTQSQEQISPDGEEGSAGAPDGESERSAPETSGEAGTSAAGADGVGALRSPDDVRVEVVDATSVRINWIDRSDDEVGFELQRDTGVSGDEQSRNVAENQTSFEWNGLESGTTQCFRVRAVGGAAPSKWEPGNDRGYACADLPLLPAPTPSPTPSPSVSPAPSPEPSPTASPTSQPPASPSP